MTSSWWRAHRLTVAMSGLISLAMSGLVLAGTAYTTHAVLVNRQNGVELRAQTQDALNELRATERTAKATLHLLCTQFDLHTQACAK